MRSTETSAGAASAGFLTEERFAPANGIELAYDEIGERDGVPVILVMGLATQLVHWDLRFCGILADHGYRVIRFDNRDVGRSSRIDAPVPATAPMLLGYGKSAYRLSDMAADTVGLLDHLGIERAHVVGASMGGMIAQTLAIEHPERVRSLTSIMSTTGSRRYGLPRWRAFGALISRPGRTREEFIERAVKTFRIIGSPAYPMDEPRFRDLVAVAYDRGHSPAGVARQLHAITTSGDRTKALQRLQVPTLVIHGSADPLVRPAAGRATARAIPGAKLKVFEGMGHDFPAALHQDVADEFNALAERASN
jgi:pimeloyl-ACP methyl ester carboxylesterase